MTKQMKELRVWVKERIAELGKQRQAAQGMGNPHTAASTAGKQQAFNEIFEKIEALDVKKVPDDK
jgi:hypothetical protein